MRSNLPPGVQSWQIPGNRPQDIAFQDATEAVLDEWAEDGREGTEEELIEAAGLRLAQDEIEDAQAQEQADDWAIERSWD